MRFASGQRSVLFVDGTVLLGDEAYSFCAHALAQPAPTRGALPFDSKRLHALGDVRLSLPVVAGRALIEPSCWQQLREGDALMPGSGWFVQTSPEGLVGPIALCSGGACWGLSASLQSGGQLVLGNGSMSVDPHADENDSQVSDEAQQPPASELVAQALADTPVVVRVELGAVTLTAREWASLQPGDVIATGRRIAERVSLRIGGQTVASGELVDVEGELGVRIHALGSH